MPSSVVFTADSLPLGLLWPCPQILRPNWKGFIRTNTVAYMASSSATKEKSFITLTPGVNVIKPFFFITDDDAK